MKKKVELPRISLDLSMVHYDISANAEDESVTIAYAGGMVILPIEVIDKAARYYEDALRREGEQGPKPTYVTDEARKKLVEKAGLELDEDY